MGGGGLTFSRLPQRAATVFGSFGFSGAFKLLFSCPCLLSDETSSCPPGAGGRGGQAGAFRDSSLLGPPRLPNAEGSLKGEMEDEERGTGKRRLFVLVFLGLSGWSRLFRGGRN